MLPNRVLVAMSGGVDSSVAAALLVEQGYDVVGVTMKLFSDGTDLPDRPCCSLDSTSDARRVCERLGIPHYVVNMESRFTRDVVDDFVAEYVAGRTPIPCVRCNTFTKFRDLLHAAATVDAQWIATGHYARITDGRLTRGRDESKDQTYFLWGIDRDVVQRLILPVGNLTKPETRAIAERLGLTMVAHKPESQDICFVPDGDHTRIIAQRAGADSPALARGPIVTMGGEVIGEHEGYARYTVGQRKGLPGGFAEPLYVVEIRPGDRAVIVGPRAALLGRGLRARGVNWLVDPAPLPGARVLIRARHRATLTPAELVSVDGSDVEIALDEPVAAITPGQSLVMYDDGGAVLGGGIIAVASRAAHATHAGHAARALPVLAA